MERRTTLDGISRKEFNRRAPTGVTPLGTPSPSSACSVMENPTCRAGLGAPK